MTNLQCSEDSKTELLTEPSANPYPPLLPLLSLIYSYFAFLWSFVLLETIMTTLAMDLWAWTPQAAVARMGFIIMGGGGLSIVLFAMIGPLCKM